MSRSGAVALRPAWDRRRWLLLGVSLGIALVTVASMRVVDLSVTALAAGAADMGALLGRMLPPAFVDVPSTVRLVAETFFIALAGTAMAVVLSLPLAVLAARNTTRGRAWLAVARGVISACRAIPDLVFALVFVRALGIGVLPGILALGLHSIGMLGKLFADAIEEIDPGPGEAVAAVGAGRLQALVTGVLPQVIPSIIARSLYRLDINVRLSTVLGFVGAGGIGQLLRTYLGSLRYAEALGVALCIFGLVLAVEALSASARWTLLGQARGNPRLLESLARRLGGSARSPVSPPWTTERLARAGYALLLAVGLAASVAVTRVSPVELVAAVPEIVGLLPRFVPPDFASVAGALPGAMAETVAIGFAATLIGTMLSVPVALLAARNVAPARWVFVAARALVVGVRGVPELILAVVFVAALGLGPFPGVMALGIGSIGLLAKLLADAVEEVRQGPLDAIGATGASRLQQTATAVVPQMMPAFIGNTLYLLDVNIRSSVVLGIVGAGGVGFLLIQSTRTLRFDVTAAILLLVFAVVYAIERLSGWIRRQLI